MVKKIVAKNVKLVESWRFSNPVFSLSFPVVDADGGVPAQRGPLGVVRDLVGGEAGEARQPPLGLERQLVGSREGVPDP